VTSARWADTPFPGCWSRSHLPGRSVCAAAACASAGQRRLPNRPTWPQECAHLAECHSRCHLRSKFSPDQESGRGRHGRIGGKNPSVVITWVRVSVSRRVERIRALKSRRVRSPFARAGHRRHLPRAGLMRVTLRSWFF
jgi:hypothetical protein